RRTGQSPAAARSRLASTRLGERLIRAFPRWTWPAPRRGTGRPRLLRTLRRPRGGGGTRSSQNLTCPCIGHRTPNRRTGPRRPGAGRGSSAGPACSWQAERVVGLGLGGGRGGQRGLAGVEGLAQLDEP